MKISTRLVGLMSLMLASFSTYAATVVVMVGAIAGSTPTPFSPKNTTVRPANEVRWEWVSGNHWSVADGAVAFAPFSVNANTPATLRPFNTMGTITYHSQPHSLQANTGGPWQGMASNITVTNMPQASLNAKAVGVALTVYPNPSKGLVVVTLNQKVGPEYKLRLSNVLGREIRSFALRTEASNSGMPLNLSDLPAGMYFYSLVLNDKVVSTKRFVLQN